MTMREWAVVCDCVGIWRERRDDETTAESEMVEIDVDEEGYVRLDLMSATEYSS